MAATYPEGTVLHLTDGARYAIWAPDVQERRWRLSLDGFGTRVALPGDPHSPFTISEDGTLAAGVEGGQLVVERLGPDGHREELPIAGLPAMQWNAVAVDHNGQVLALASGDHVVVLPLPDRDYSLGASAFSISPPHADDPDHQSGRLVVSLCEQGDEHRAVVSCQRGFQLIRAVQDGSGWRVREHRITTDIHRVGRTICLFADQEKTLALDATGRVTEFRDAGEPCVSNLPMQLKPRSMAEMLNIGSSLEQILDEDFLASMGHANMDVAAIEEAMKAFQSDAQRDLSDVPMLMDGVFSRDGCRLAFSTLGQVHGVERIAPGEWGPIGAIQIDEDGYPALAWTGARSLAGAAMYAGEIHNLEL